MTQADVKSLCVTCHADKAKLIDTAKVPHPGAAGDCTDCHSPHASRRAGLPENRTRSISAWAATLTRPSRPRSACSISLPLSGAARPATRPHGGDNDHLLRAKGNALCLECHGPDSQPQRLESEHVLTIFNGKVKLPEDYYQKNKVAILPLRMACGHPVEGHPVPDLLDPKDPTKVTTRLNCLSCHQPHSSAQEGLLVKDQANNMAFCDTCHKNRIEMIK